MEDESRIVDVKRSSFVQKTADEMLRARGGAEIGVGESDSVVVERGKEVVVVARGDTVVVVSRDHPFVGRSSVSFTHLRLPTNVEV